MTPEQEKEAVLQALQEYEDDKPWNAEKYVGFPNPTGITIDSDGTAYRVRMPTESGGNVPGTNNGAD